MFGMGMPELLLILVVALVVVGPRKLPDIAKALGKGMRQFREATDEIKQGLQDNETYQEFNEAKKSFKDTMDSVNPKTYLNSEDFDLEPKEPVTDLSGRKHVYEQIEKEYAQEAAAQQGPPEVEASTEPITQSEAQTDESALPADTGQAAPEAPAKKDA